VCTAIDAVHNDVASVIELISQPLECDAPHDQGGHPGRIDDRVLALLPCIGALHRANDVTKFAHRTQCRLGFSIEMPPALSRLLRKAHVGESIKAADEKRASLSSLNVSCVQSKVNHGISSHALNIAIEARPTLLIDLTVQGRSDLAYGRCDRIAIDCFTASALCAHHTVQPYLRHFEACAGFCDK
jgi:hypothetical protein